MKSTRAKLAKFKPDDRFVISDNSANTDTRDSWVFLALEDNTFFATNAMGRCLVQLLQEEYNFAQMVDEVHQRYPEQQKDNVQADVELFLNDLIKSKLIDVR